MPIDDSVDVFPNNAVTVIKDRFQTLASDLFIIGRPLRETDATQSVGVFGSTWQPDEESYEIKGGVLGSEPTLQRYAIGVQGFVKDMDEQRGLRVAGVLGKMLRAMLYRDSAMGVSLRALQVTMLGSTERLTRYGVRNQVYDSNEIPKGTWLYLSTLDFWIETEST